MKLLVIALVLVALRFIDHGARPQFDGVGRYLRGLRALIANDSIWSGPVFPWIALLLPVLALEALSGFLGWLWQIPLAFVVLWLCLGPRELAADLRAWLAARAGDRPAAAEVTAQEIWGANNRPTLGQLFVISHERLFGVLLWFCVLGPAGALLYRLACRIPAQWPVESGTVEKMHAALAFVPARLTAVLFALAGSADDVLAKWRQPRAHLDWSARTWAWLSTIASASAMVEEVDSEAPVTQSLEESANEFLDLEFRALMILLATLAIITVGNWVG